MQFKLLEEGGEWWSLPENVSEESKSTWHYFEKKKKPYFSEGYRHMIMWYSVGPKGCTTGSGQYEPYLSHEYTARTPGIFLQIMLIRE